MDILKTTPPERVLINTSEFLLFWGNTLYDVGLGSRMLSPQRPKHPLLIKMPASIAPQATESFRFCFWLLGSICQPPHVRDQRVGSGEDFAADVAAHRDPGEA